MKVIKAGSEKGLVESIDKIDPRHSSWAVIFIGLSKLNRSLDLFGLDTFLSLIVDMPELFDTSLYVMANKDCAIVIPLGADDTKLKNIASHICYHFAKDQLAQSPLGAQGNDFCQIIREKKDLMDLYRQALSLNSELERNAALTSTSKNRYNMNTSTLTNALDLRRVRDRLCILIIEDQQFSRRLVVESLNKFAEVLSAENGFEALKLYEQNAPDIVFLDINLPGMNGHEVLRQITKMDKDAFVVMLTASDKIEDVQGALKEKARGYIVKPFTRKKLDQYINLYVQKNPGRASAVSS